jgi:hypothetical protein
MLPAMPELSADEKLIIRHRAMLNPSNRQHENKRGLSIATDIDIRNKYMHRLELSEHLNVWSTMQTNDS